MAAPPPPNITRFNLITLEVLRTLYEAFPRPIDLYPLEIAGRIGDSLLEGVPEEARDQVIWSMEDTIAESISWLESEGFLTVGLRTMHDTAALRSRLSMRGLTAIGGPSITPEKSNWTSMSEALREKGPELAAGVMKDLFLGLMNAGFR